MRIDPRFAMRGNVRWARLLTYMTLFVASLSCPFSGNHPRRGLLCAQESRSSTYQLRHVEAKEVAPQVQRMFTDSDTKAEVLVDRRSNRVLVEGPEQAHRLASQLIQTLDRPVDRMQQERAAEQQVTVKGYVVAQDRLEETAQQLRNQYADQPDVKVAVDTRTSQLVIVASQATHQEINAALRRWHAIEQSRPARSSTVPAPTGRHRLRNISWRELEDQLRRVWGERLVVNTVRNGEIATVSMPTPEGVQDVIKIDRRQDQVTFPGPEATRGSWEQVVRAIDGTSRGEQARVLPLGRAEPAKIDHALRLLRNASRQGAGMAAAALEVDRRRPRWGGDLVSMIFQDQQPDEQPALQPEPDPNRLPANQEPNPNGQEAPPLPEDTPEEEEPEASGVSGDVRIEVIPELNTIILIGPKRDVARVQRIIDEIIQQSQTVQPEVALLPLQHVNSQTIADLLVSLYDQVFAPRQGPLSITSLDKPNALMLIGRQEAVDTIKQLVAKLDQPVDPTSQLEVIHLKYLPALEALRLVRSFLTNLPGEEGDDEQVSPEALRPAMGTRVRVIADFRTNSLILSAAARDMEEVKYFLEKLDVPGTEASNELRVFRLQNTLAAELAPVIQEAVSGQPAEGAGPSVQGVAQIRPSTKLSIIGVDSNGNKVIDSGILTDVTVTADPNVNALLVRASAESMALIAELIRQLDQLPNAEAQIKVFHIENGDATSLAAMLQSLFGQEVTAGQGNLGRTLQQAFGTGAGAASGESSLVPLRFAVDVRTNSIIVSGMPGDLNVVEILLLRLDEGDVQNRKITVYRLKNAPALDVANSVSTLLQSQRTLIQQQLLLNQAVSPFQQVESEVIVVPELVTNSLIVSATPRYFEPIMEVVEALDFRPPMVMVQVLIAEVTLDDAFEFGVELGLQDSLLFDRGVVMNGMTDPGFNFNNQPLGNSSDAASLATREQLAGQALTAFSLGRSSSNLGYGGLVLSAANESISILIRALQDAGRLQILSRPQVMALDNQPAFVQVGARVPRITASNITPQGGTQNSTQDEDVGLLLRLQPRINEDGLIVMNIDAEKSEVGPIEQGIPVAVTENGQVINSPQINTTTAQTTISAYSGQTVVFAGLMTKSRSIQSRRVPWLSDVPVLGRLFRFDAESTKRTELLIIMTPYIVNEDADYEWLKYTESERMSWCLSDVIDLHGNVGLSGGNGLWGPPRSPVIYPDLDPSGLNTMPHFIEEVDPPLLPGTEGAVPSDSGLTPTPAVAPPDRSNRRPREDDQPQASRMQPAAVSAVPLGYRPPGLAPPAGPPRGGARGGPAGERPARTPPLWQGPNAGRFDAPGGPVAPAAYQQPANRQTRDPADLPSRSAPGPSR